jgi:energy-converting hydrogenase Eha subunit A
MEYRTLLALAAVTLAACDVQAPTAPELSSSARPEFSTLLDGTLDQSQSVSDGYGFFGFFMQQAQTFTAGLTGNLSQVDVELSRIGSPGSITVQIRTVSSGVPSNTILASATIAESSVSAISSGWISVPLTPSVAITAGTQYAIILAAPATPPCCDGYQWAVSFQDPYAGGTFAHLQGRNGSWQVLAAVDNTFKTYVTPLGPSSKNQCEKGMWNLWGFENQGQCVRFVETGKDSRTASNIWTTKAPMPTPRELLAVGAINNILYAVGGFAQGSLDVVEAYNPATNSWTTKASLPTPRMGAAVGVVNGILYTVGGWNNLGGGLVGTVEAYDPATNSWTTKASLPTPRYLLSVGVVNGILYAVGGGIGPVFVGNVEAYDPVTDSWTTKASLPTPRAELSVGVVNGILYAVGGADPSYNVTGAVEAYDPASNSWTTKASLITPRIDFGVGVANGVLYAVGGWNNLAGGLLGTVEAYDPLTNSWTTRAPMLTPRVVLSIGVVNGVLYAVGGMDASSQLTGVLEAYQP